MFVGSAVKYRAVLAVARFSVAPSSGHRLRFEVAVKRLKLIAIAKKANLEKKISGKLLGIKTLNGHWLETLFSSAGLRNPKHYSP